jgi:hypothetical protein
MNEDGEEVEKIEPPDLEGDCQEELEILLTDYRQASEEARYRDEILQSSHFYVSIIFIAGLAATLTQALTTASSGILLSFVGFAGAFTFFVIRSYVKSFKNSRNSAWNRRRVIEEIIQEEYPGTLRTNKSIVTQLSQPDTNSDNDWYYDGEMDSSASKRIDLYIWVSIIFSLILGIIGVGLILTTTEYIGCVSNIVQAII